MQHPQPTGALIVAQGNGPGLVAKSVVKIKSVQPASIQQRVLLPLILMDAPIVY